MRSTPIKKAVFMGLGLISSIISPFTYAGTGRGDFHTVYQGQTIDELIIRYMEKNKIPGLSLAIVQAPYITRIVGYGLADIQKKTLVGSHTIFDVGQLTNAFTAVAIMQLKEEDKLSLNDSISKYLTVPQAWSNITIENLMTHQSGLPSYSDSAEFNFDKQYSQDDILNLIKDKPLNFEPGSQVRQSATNAYLLGMIIEKASGTSYEEYVTKNQFERLGLKHTFFSSTLYKIKNEIDNETEPFKHTQFLENPVFINPTEPATGYVENAGKLEPTKIINFSGSFANSGIFASAEDISFWDIALAGNILVKDPKNRDFLYHPVKLKNGKMSPGNVGWFFPGHPGLMEIKGNVPGYSAFLSRFTDPSELLCVTLLVNKEGLVDLDILAREIAGAFDVKLAVPPSAAWTQVIQSPYSVKETIERVASLVKQQGGTVFAEIDHSEEGKKAGQTLLDTQVIIFGNPAKGTSLMQANPAMAIDLPLKMMARQDANGQIWLSFTDPLHLAKQYGANEEQTPHLLMMSNALKKLAEKAVSPDSINTD